MIKYKKLLAATMLGVMLFSTVAFADETVLPQQNTISTVKTAPDKVDPIKRLEDIKAKVTEKYNQGKISKEKYDNMISKINEKEQYIKGLNSLTLSQKRQKLISDFTAAINKKVQSGRITQDKANELIKKYTDKVNKWDGTGFPPGMKGFKNGGGYRRFKNA
ncbi:MAG: hypothetical protein QJR05_13800, partial [Thermoanaerobacterium sp.]|nr:hypothetical protein [Thermoanaerobacterium sp.]